MLYHGCRRDSALSGMRSKSSDGRASIKMPVISGECYVYVVELMSQNGAKIWSDEITVRT